MIDLYFWTTPNGYKPAIFLEEAGVPYNILPVNIAKHAQFEPNFLKISPNNKIPAIVDHEPKDGLGPQSLFESGAILWYLAEKTGKFVPQSARGKALVSEWLFWQVGGFGPMLGQMHHFNAFAKEKIPYAIERFGTEARRLYGVLDKQLSTNEFVAGEYSIADMAIYPWSLWSEKQGIDIKDFPNVAKYRDKISARPAVQRAYAIKV